MKVFLPAPQENWIVDRIIDEFKQNTTHQITENIQEADIIWLYANFVWSHFPLEILKNKFVLTTFHHFVHDKFNIENFKIIDSFTNAYHIPNIHTQAFLKKITNKPIYRLCYWINDKLFYKKEIDKQKYNLPQDKIIIYNNFRDTEGAGIERGIYLPKKEKGSDIFIEILKNLNKNKFHILLSGWRRQYIIQHLTMMNFPFSYFEMIKDINELYNISDLIIVPSRFEGGPSNVIEGSQLKVKILSTDVGVASEILHPDCICNSVNEFVDKIENRNIDHTIDYNYNKVQEYTLQKMIQKYDNLLSSLNI